MDKRLFEASVETEVEESSSLYLLFQSLHWPSTAREAWAMIKELLHELAKPLLKQARKLPEYDENRPVVFYFWASRTAMAVYANIWLALTLGRFWLLYGVSGIIFVQIMWIALKWVVYVIDDPAMVNFSGFVRDYFRVLLTQGEKILQGKDAARYIIAGALLKSAPTGLEYFRWILRWKTREVNNEVIATIVEDRYGLRVSALRADLNARLKRAGENAYKVQTRFIPSSQKSIQTLEAIMVRSDSVPVELST